MTPRVRSPRPAYTLIELLVVVAIIVLLIGIVFPSLVAARVEAQRIKCLANLQAIGQACQAYATEDPNYYIIPVHPVAERGWRFDGEFEYGGGWATLAGPVGNIFRALSPESRPLNRFLFAAGAVNSLDYKMFRCPGDTGIVDAPRNYDPSLPIGVPIVDISGTSYRVNNHIRMYTDTHFYGPYLRRMHRVPETGSTVLIAETPAQVAVYNPPPFISPGWHGRDGHFNVAFADGHSGRIQIQGGNEPPREEYDGYWIFRGDGWRLDCYPDPPIRDRF